MIQSMDFLIGKTDVRQKFFEIFAQCLARRPSCLETAIEAVYSKTGVVVYDTASFLGISAFPSGDTHWTIEFYEMGSSHLAMRRQMIVYRIPYKSIIDNTANELIHTLL